jgi:hypothetical protein
MDDVRKERERERELFFVCVARVFPNPFIYSKTFFFFLACVSIYNLPLKDKPRGESRVRGTRKTHTKMHG